MQWYLYTSFQYCIIFLFLCAVNGSCGSDKTSDDMYGEYWWPKTSVGSNDTKPCNYGGYGNNAMATHFCDFHGFWSDVIFNQCFTFITSQYQLFDIVSSTKSISDTKANLYVNHSILRQTLMHQM